MHSLKDIPEHQTSTNAAVCEEAVPETIRN
jgi:hypothetical protein